MNAISDTRQRILDSARELIYARSYTDVGVAAICEQAGVKKGSFYHFFPSKQELTLAVIDDLFVDFKERIYNDPSASDAPPLQRLRRFADRAYLRQREIVDQTGQTLGCPFGNLAAELSTQDGEIRRKVDIVFQRIERYFAAILTEAVETGEVGEIDIPATAQAMVAYAEGIMLMAKARNDPEIIRQLGPAMVDIRIPNSQ
jgi:TetR/AcrR family transcriptional repressor of nem operon